MVPSFTCPDCGTVTRDHAAIRTGWCAHCKDHTGLCAAGRALAYTAVLNAAGWHDGCTLPGEVLVEFPRGGRMMRRELCTGHAAEIRDGRAPWARGVRMAGGP